MLRRYIQYDIIYIKIIINGLVSFRFARRSLVYITDNIDNTSK